MSGSGNDVVMTEAPSCPDHTWHSMIIPAASMQEDARTIRDIRSWCYDQFGKQWDWIGWGEGDWDYTFSSGKPSDRYGYKFTFRHEADAVLFKLRWL